MLNNKNAYKKIIQDNLVESFDIVYVSGYKKNDAVVIDTKYLPTGEEASFLFKGWCWYKLPHLEKVRTSSELHNSLNSLKKRFDDGLYDIIREPNSKVFITED